MVVRFGLMLLGSLLTTRLFVWRLRTLCSGPFGLDVGGLRRLVYAWRMVANDCMVPSVACCVAAVNSVDRDFSVSASAVRLGGVDLPVSVVGVVTSGYCAGVAAADYGP